MADVTRHTENTVGSESTLPSPVFNLPPAIYGADMIGMGIEHYQLLTESLRECVTILSRLIDMNADGEFKSTYPDPYGAINDARVLLGLPRLAPPDALSDSQEGGL